MDPWSRRLLWGPMILGGTLALFLLTPPIIAIPVVVAALASVALRRRFR